MNLITLVVTRNKSVSVKTLHTILKLNVLCMSHRHNNNIIFLNDTPMEKNDCINKYIKKCDRLVFIDYSVSANDESLEHIVKDTWDFHGIVFPCVLPGIDWDMFKEKVMKDSEEPKEQCGLHFDTEIGQKHKDDFYFIKNTNPKMWCINTKHILKHLKNSQFHYENISKYINNGLRLVADTSAKLIVTYPHECVGNILGAAGVTSS